jgi:maleate isomerase
VLAFRELFRRTGVTRVGLVTPYLDDVQAKIIANWSAAGFACSAERHRGLQDNFSFATVAPEEIAAMTRSVVQDGCEAVAIVCTNMRGAHLAARLEAELGVPVYDSVAVTLLECLRLAGCDPRVIRGWGGLFSDPRNHPWRGGST